MNLLKIKICTFFFIPFLMFFTLSFAADKAEHYSTAPKLNKGAKWRIGYYEGGEYINYQKTLMAIVSGLMALGWIEKSEIPPQNGIQTRELWNWLATQAKSKYLEFVNNAHYSANWDKTLRQKTADAIIRRLNTDKDIDLMFSMGTWAGQDLVNNKHKTPVMVMATSDPVAAGILKSTEDSGYDHVHARVDPFRYERQIRVFHSIIGFKKLGVAYEDTVAGRSYAAVEKIEKVARIKDFEIIRCYIKTHVADIKIAEESVKECFRELVKKTDAIYVPGQAGVNSNTIPELAKIANDFNIPTFFQNGEDGVRQGFLMTISPIDFDSFGNFYAETAAKIFNGASPRQLPMYVKISYKWDFNFETAKKIGLDISELNMETDYLNLSDLLDE